MDCLCLSGKHSQIFLPPCSLCKHIMHPPASDVRVDSKPTGCFFGSSNIECMKGGWVATGRLNKEKTIPVCLSVCLFLSSLSLGIFTHSLRTVRVIASQSLYTHRHHPNLMVMEVLLVRQGTSQEPITIKMDSGFTPQSDDIVFHSEPDYKGAR